MPNYSRLRQIAYIIFIALFFLLLFVLFNSDNKKVETISLSQVVEEAQSDQIEQIDVKGTALTIKLKNGVEQKSFKEELVSLTNYKIDPTKVKINVLDNSNSGLWLNILISVGPIILFVVFLFFMLRGAQGGTGKAFSFTQSQPRLFLGGKKKITFKDVAGLEEAKEELNEVVEFLKSPGKFEKLGAAVPKGVLLFGPPGCGKTLLAKAVAGEANVPFFSISGSEFVELFVGVGAARVRDLFEKAKRNAPSIIFVDELDAVGRQRGTGLGGTHDEREQTLNQILVEMDGFDTDTRVIVMAATNRSDVLDPALLRPGRFDRRVVLTLPTKNEREAILKIHALNKPIAKNVNLEKIAATTAGFSGADLENLLNEGAILTARHNKKEIGQKEIEEALEKVILGPQKKSRLLNEKDKKLSAYHEAGHALVGEMLPNNDPVHKISLISRGEALGYTWSLPKEDLYLTTRSKFKDQLASLLGGRVAEEVVLGEISTGAENDLRRSTKIAREMVANFGMSEKIGPIVYGEREELIFLGKELAEHKILSEKTASMIDEEIRNVIEEAYGRAKDILNAHRDALDDIVDALLKKEEIGRKEFLAILSTHHIKSSHLKK
ncbi:MAG: ATP-dependent zinc metalloprotease FtsH [Patescibacteria group bacterium]|nr:ATP-dependent zinc metalloprotease FtsH [Patescibacteria group bacterium]